MNPLTTQSSCEDPNEQALITVEKALTNMLLAVTEKTACQQVPLVDAIDQVLATPIISPINVPAHRNSAVDGYAILKTDLPLENQFKSLQVITKVVAGHPYDGPLEPGQAIQIMTGAQMPRSADAVIMQEHVEILHNMIRIDGRHRPGQNIRQAGEDIQQGQTVLQAGIKLTPPQIGLLASLGITDILVKKPLRVAVISTGDEILNIGEQAREGCIYDSNRYSLITALKKLGCEVLDLGITADEPETLKKTFLNASLHADVIFTSGGVSVGEADYTKQVLAEIGHINFWKMALKPGRPIAFGHINNTTFFGLPGNPVAVMVTFYQFALPVMQKLVGLTHPLINPTIKAQCTHPIRKLPGRTEYQRGVLSQDPQGLLQVSTTGQQGSGILRSMSIANVFIVLEHDRSSVEKGEWVIVQPFSGLF